MKETILEGKLKEIETQIDELKDEASILEYRARKLYSAATTLYDSWCEFKAKEGAT